ncbi:MAG TPA: protein-L-isoaspartate(D-aspartate) O-methyltransferase [Bryobacteraceae bacterium]|nr:protein-L-isoaspartate(D-aspartate) O-methyltransferase [Bryobacteraceae bacterium]HPU72946.1 protein-L-isoaspartate(D-aspartate) O-methyltransferase [Bryobacteraceae bacterium]
MDWSAKRHEMVERQLRARGIRDERVLAAMAEIPREEFVPESQRASCYADEPAPIGYGQTISQPYMTALMAEGLELKGTETVLEVGAGCGYHTAVLGALAARVVSIELIPELAEMARSNLARTGRLGNVTVIVGDGSLGWPEEAPYDAISVEAAAVEAPPALLEQLRDPGRMVMPVGPDWDQELLVLCKAGGRITKRVAAYCRFVPLR